MATGPDDTCFRRLDPLKLSDEVGILQQEVEEGRYGGWVHDAELGDICWRPGGRDEYSVCLERLDTRVEVLDWIAHIQQKRWATDSVLAGFVRIVEDVVGLRKLK